MLHSKLPPRMFPKVCPTIWPLSEPRHRLLARLEEEIERQLEVVTARMIYVDTINIHHQYAFPLGYFSQSLMLNNPGAVDRYSSSHLGWANLTLHRPNRGSLNYLQSIVGAEHMVNRIDFALDLATETQEQAHTLERFIRRHARQTWHGKRHVNISDGTTYFAPAWKGRNIAIYADRPSKITRGPCVHIEFRFTRAATVGKAGLRKISDVLSADPIRLLQRNMRLSVPDIRAIRKEIDNTIGKTVLRENRRGSNVNRALVAKHVQVLLSRAMGIPYRLLSSATAQQWCELQSRWWPGAAVAVDAAPNLLINRLQCPFFL